MKKFFIFFFIAIIGVFAFYVSGLIYALPSTYEGVARFMVDKTISETHALNAVTAIVFDFRGYDTLGESFVLVTAVTGVAVILKNVKGGRKDETK
jgi:multicomponent Na+:H+ antiporter subunit B